MCTLGATAPGRVREGGGPADRRAISRCIHRSLCRRRRGGSSAPADPLPIRRPHGVADRDTGIPAGIPIIVCRCVSHLYSRRNAGHCVERLELRLLHRSPRTGSLDVVGFDPTHEVLLNEASHGGAEKEGVPQTSGRCRALFRLTGVAGQCIHCTQSCTGE